MGDTPTANEVVHRLVELSGLLDKATADYAALDESAVKARSAYEVAFARAFLTAEGAMDIRRYRAVLASSGEKLTAESAEQKVRACRARITKIRDQIEVHRSLNSAVRSEWVASSIGQH